MPAATGGLRLVLVGQLDLGQLRGFRLDAINDLVFDRLVNRNEGLERLGNLHLVQVVHAVAVVAEQQLAVPHVVREERPVENVRVAMDRFRGQLEPVQVRLPGSIGHEQDLRTVLRERRLRIVVQAERQLHPLLRSRQIDTKQLLVAQDMRREHDALTVR